eukprot:763978-Hanusia_phi.AAC.1
MHSCLPASFSAFSTLRRKMRVCLAIFTKALAVHYKSHTEFSPLGLIALRRACRNGNPIIPGRIRRRRVTELIRGPTAICGGAGPSTLPAAPAMPGRNHCAAAAMPGLDDAPRLVPGSLMFITVTVHGSR